MTSGGRHRRTSRGRASQAAGYGRSGGYVIIAILLIGAFVGIALGGLSWFTKRFNTAPVAGQQRCVATTAKHSTSVSLEQAHYASIIAGVSMRRGLPARAASIAIATAYQESGIRNLDYGDRDSVGLFQQRPSSGWGSQKQLMDPYYATTKFYNALVRVPNWETRDLNDVAQAVQISGHPEAYRDHVADARTLASVLTGESPGGFSCLDRERTAGDAAALATSMQKTFGKAAKPVVADNIVTIKAKTTRQAWAYGSFAVANCVEFGTVRVVVGGKQWDTSKTTLPDWRPADHPQRATAVEISVR